MIGFLNEEVAKIELKPRGYYFNLATEIKNKEQIQQHGQQQLHLLLD